VAKARDDKLSMAEDADLIGQIYLDAGRADQAQASYERALALFRAAQVPPAVRATADVYMRFIAARLALVRGDLAGAVAAAAEYHAQVERRHVPDEIRSAHLLDGLIADARGDHRAAVVDLEQANQNDPRVLLALARAQAAAGDRAAALVTCKRALVFNRPDLSNAFVRVPGLALLKELTSGAAS